MSNFTFQSARLNENGIGYNYPALVDAAYDMYIEQFENCHEIETGCMCRGMDKGCCFEDLQEAAVQLDKIYHFVVVLDTICGNRVFPLYNNKENK